MRKFVRLSALPVAFAALAACGAPSAPAAPEAVVSMYPLEFLAEEITGGTFTVTNVVPTGAEPHDIELTIRDVTLMESADLTVIVGGFQPAVDAVAAESEHLVDIAPSLDLQVRDGVLDPHFWLDPGRMITAAAEITSLLIEASPEQADVFEENSNVIRGELQDLDLAYASALASCEHEQFVTGHAAFGYLADAYGLQEIAIAGIDPDTEPSTAALRATGEHVRALGLPMVFAEPGETKIAEVLAAELGIDYGVLNPVEAVEPGQTYLSLMYDNLEALKGGLECH